MTRPTVLTTFGGLTNYQIIRAVSEVARGLSYIHNLGEIHRDLKPRNGTSHVYIV